MIMPMTSAHIEQVVSVHQHSFQGFFLSLLGRGFLSLFYSAGVVYAEGVGYVYIEDDRITGFVFGVANSSKFYRYLLQTRWLRFAIAALSATWRDPTIIRRLLRAWRYPSQTAKQPEAATLMSIAVSPDVQGIGIGTELVLVFLEAMRARGIRYVSLTTDRLDNDRANAFYSKRGFSCSRTFTTPEGRQMNEYVFFLR
jgi:ribosomal protein S18 acetylase RimI-like enzyme